MENFGTRGSLELESERAVAFKLGIIEAIGIKDMRDDVVAVQKDTPPTTKTDDGGAPIGAIVVAVLAVVMVIVALFATVAFQ